MATHNKLILIYIMVFIQGLACQDTDLYTAVGCETAEFSKPIEMSCEDFTGTISVQSGISAHRTCQNTTGCCPEESDCQQPLTSENMNQIKSICDGKKSCTKPIKHDIMQHGFCHSPWRINYEKVHYNCVLSTGSTNAETSKQTFPTSGPPQTTVKISTTPGLEGTMRASSQFSETSIQTLSTTGPIHAETTGRISTTPGLEGTTRAIPSDRTAVGCSAFGKIVKMSCEDLSGTISVQSGTSAHTTCQNSTGCCLKDSDCQQPLTSTNLNNIRVSCDGRKSCNWTIYARYMAFESNCHAVLLITYEKLSYNCVLPTSHPDTSIQTFPTTGPTQTTVKISVTTGEEGTRTVSETPTTEADMDGLGPGVITAIAVSATLVIVVAGVVFRILVRRRGSLRPDTEVVWNNNHLALDNANGPTCDAEVRSMISITNSQAYILPLDDQY